MIHTLNGVVAPSATPAHSFISSAIVMGRGGSGKGDKRHSLIKLISSESI